MVWPVSWSRVCWAAFSVARVLRWPLRQYQTCLSPGGLAEWRCSVTTLCRGWDQSSGESVTLTTSKAGIANSCPRPLIGAVVVAYYDWEWTQWVYLFIAVPVVLPGLLFIRESKQSVLEAKAADDTSFKDRLKPQLLAKGCVSFVKEVPEFMSTSLLRPLEMLFTELIVGLVCAFAGFNFGLIYALVIVLPDVFKSTYGFDTIDQGLAFLGLIVGCILGPACLLVDNEIVVRQAARVEEAGETPSPETRLHGAMFGSILLPIGLFWFAWTARPSISYLSPIFATVLITLGALTIYVSSSAYLIDVYGPKYGASANGATSIARYTMAAIVPLFILQMYDGLGTGWATSLLGFCALALMPIPFCFYWWGPALRSRCKFQTEQ